MQHSNPASPLLPVRVRHACITFGAGAHCIAVITEICQSEAAYVADLRTLVEVYSTPLRNERILNEAYLRRIFLNTEELLGTNEALLEALQCDDLLAVTSPDKKRT